MLERPWTSSCDEVLRRFHTSLEKGLDREEIAGRRRKYGPNRLREVKRKSAWLILAEQFKSLMVGLLAVACALSFVFQEWVEGIAIAIVIALNATIGFMTEIGAVRSMEALRRLTSVSAKVRREGELQEIPAEQLVPGDIVVLEGGDIVTADLRLIEASKLQADESALTGESVPVSKSREPLPGDVPLAERKNILFKGTSVTRGSGAGVVVATGMRTELGEISALVAEAEEERTPLEKQLDKLGGKLIWLTIAIAILVVVTGILAGKEVFLMIETGIALAVAAVPEGLPVVATIALARGMYRMARRNALINRLSAVESLGATNVIFTDKTGTLTENRMTVTQLALESGRVTVEENGFSIDGEHVNPSQESLLREILELGVLCNNAELRKDEPESEDRAVGDPLEVALLAAGLKAAIERKNLASRLPEVREEAFDADLKMMATFHAENGRYRVAVKGAPEPVLEACTRIRTREGDETMDEEERKRWLSRNNQMAKEGLRIIALATKTVESAQSAPYENLTFVGLAGLLDPPRGDVRSAIESCQEAGIRVVMVTGDQPVTARNIAIAVGLVDDGEVAVLHGKDLKSPDELSEEERRKLLAASIFARVSPKQKLDLIALYQKNGSIVAMTGDGVNDAPALKKADIGVAMGLRGTQVAREAADMILKDDAFSTIVAAVEQGRVIFGNIRKFVVYLLSCNVSEIMTVSLAALANAPLPLLPLQILFLNLVTDVFPALALGMGEGEPGIMKQPPRDPKEPILKRRHWRAIGGYSFVITLSVLGALALALSWLKMDTSRAVTVSFLTLAFAQIWHVFNMSDRGSGLVKSSIIRNPYVWGAIAICVGLLLLAVYVPGLAHVLKVANPGSKGWILALGMSLIPLVIGQLLSLRSRKFAATVNT
ncbi:MAG: cation-transporting P-type ATPase [Candidatus Abyssobacteria bacterium SURF_17]|uniref:Cation-transporting P-type ATPase n=1 Tax=Candidatus Abyssobacteria bacterium SURF_17 TaxID=2093361 RepID=A0A419F8D0_9BACT|nr:MAG: cation-transporting P-type ATPase [Candidatus Abyssubacteria bacterium SURF_17]